MNKLRLLAILISLILLNAEVVFAQSSCGYFFNYQYNTGWKSVEKGNNSHPRGNISISNGQLHFNDVSNGQYDTRYYYELDSALCNSWRARFDFNFINHSGHSTDKFSHFIFALTEDTLAPAYIQNPGAGPTIIKTDHDGVFIRFGNNTSNGWHFEVYTKVGLNYTTHCQLTVPQQTGVTYQIELMRVDVTKGQIHISSSVLQNDLICCFQIPPSLGPLSVVQHANKPDASFRRALTASFSSLCIEDCLPQMCCGLPSITESHQNFNINTNTQIKNGVTTYSSLQFSPYSSLPTGYVQQWELYLAENCDTGDFQISPTNPNILRPPVFGSTAVFYSDSSSIPQLYADSCYLVKHTIIGNNGECIFERWKKVYSTQGTTKSCDYNFEYLPNSGWKSVESGVNSHQRGSITMSNGVLNFNNVSNGQYDTRVFYELDSALCNSWKANFDFNFINHSGHTSEKFSHLIFALTEDTLAPVYYQNPNTSGPTILKTNHDGIFIRFGHDNTHGWYFEVYTKVGLNYTTHCQLTVPQITDVVYNIDLMRIDSENGRIRITSNELSSPLQCCFPIPSSLGPLKVLQHANKPDASFRRSLTASFSSLCIEDCYQKQICCALDPIENHHLQWDTSLDTLTTNGETFFSSLTFSPFMALPSGYTQSWEIYYAENCDSGDVNISISHPNAIRPATFDNPGTFYSSSNSNPPLYVDSCYVILHSIIGNNGECVYTYYGKITPNNLNQMDTFVIDAGVFDCEDHFVFPNPYEKSFTVRVPQRNKDYTFRLYDIAGRLIKEGELSRSNSQFEFSDISAASYFLLIFDRGELVCRQRIVRIRNE